MIWCAFNGLGLALVIPCISSIIADYHPPDTRGKAFGIMGFVSAIGTHLSDDYTLCVNTCMLGAMAATLFATNIGGKVVFGFAGWRVAFFSVALVSVVTGVLVPLFAKDPRGGPATRRPPLTTAALAAELKALVALFASDDVQAVLRVRSFQIIILQGIVGTVPLHTTLLWVASFALFFFICSVLHCMFTQCFPPQMPWMSLSFLTLWLQLVGFADTQASSLVALFTLGCAGGSLLGGYLGMWGAPCNMMLATCMQRDVGNMHAT